MFDFETWRKRPFSCSLCRYLSSVVLKKKTAKYQITQKWTIDFSFGRKVFGAYDKMQVSTFLPDQHKPPTAFHRQNQEEFPKVRSSFFIIPTTFYHHRHQVIRIIIATYILKAKMCSVGESETKTMFTRHLWHFTLTHL